REHRWQRTAERRRIRHKTSAKAAKRAGEKPSHRSMEPQQSRRIGWASIFSTPLEPAIKV
ncbi:MAG: hypothetical protein QW390_02020, partial [Candidatus Bathyarchaeia archaeon]